MAAELGEALGGGGPQGLVALHLGLLALPPHGSGGRLGGAAQHPVRRLALGAPPGSRLISWGSGWPGARQWRPARVREGAQSRCVSPRSRPGAVAPWQPGGGSRTPPRHPLPQRFPIQGVQTLYMLSGTRRKATRPPCAPRPPCGHHACPCAAHVCGSSACPHVPARPHLGRPEPSPD